MAFRKSVKQEEPFEDAAYLEIAKTYLKMGLREDALAEYRILAQHYKSSGMKDKAFKLKALMARIDPSKASLEKRITGLKPSLRLKDRGAANTGPKEPPILQAPMKKKGKEAGYDLAAELEIADPEAIRDYKETEISEQTPGCGEILKKIRPVSSTNSGSSNFNYNMGVAFRNLGFIDDAIEHFQIAYEKRENPFEAACLLGLCFKDKTMLAEAGQAFEKALKVGGMSQGDALAVKSELGLIFREQGKPEQALKLFRKDSTVERRVRKATDGVNKGLKKSARR
jgi:tetratricopeptide (TPR) repeat protein